MDQKKIIIGICGATGVIYGIRLLKHLLLRPVEVHLILSDAGKQVLRHEAGFDGGPFNLFLEKHDVLIGKTASLYIYDEKNFFAPPASGSFRHDGMVIAPCSMKTLGVIASGTPGSLLTRSADVCLKEKRPLVLLPREMPLNLIHLENMTRAARAGAIIMPPSPSFYSRPATINALVDTVIARTLDHVGIEHGILKQWGADTKEKTATEVYRHSPEPHSHS